MNSQPKITQKRLKELFIYDPKTGIFLWRIARGRQAAGAIAGWNCEDGYRRTKVDGPEYGLHRLAILYMHGRMPDADVDHINGIRNDNRIINLRSVTRKENHKNRGISLANKSGRIGVFWNSGKQKWTARIKVDGIDHHLGHYKEIEDAASARDKAEIELRFHVNHGKRPAFSGAA